MAGEFEKLAYEAALRGLDKQEGLLEELRTRTGVLLAASSLAASFLGQQAFQNPSPRGLAITALVAFVGSIAASVFILLPKKNLIFAEAGAGLYEGLYAFRDDMPEVYRRPRLRPRPLLGFQRQEDQVANSRLHRRCECPCS